jgi:hypothetical protein
MLSEMGIDAGIDPEKTIEASHGIATLLGIEPRSHRGGGATRDAIRKSAETNPCEHP